MLVGSSSQGLVDDLRGELDLQFAGTLSVMEVAKTPAIALVDQLRTKGEAVVLMHGFDAWRDDQFVSLDVNRSRLETGAFLLFEVDLRTAGRLLDNAPNIRSYLGPNLFRIAPDASSMSPQEIADRLNQLRIHYGLSDAQVLSGVGSGELPAEPHFAEWLVLLGRSELVR
jgi:hypothetical protein